MTDSFRIFVRGDPKPKGSKRAFVVKGKPVLVEGNRETRSWEYLLAESINAEWGNDPAWEDAVEVSLVFQLRRPKSVKKRAWPYVKPDIDKLCRTVLDALVRAGTIRDDAQVVALSADKRYSETPGVFIEVRRLT